MTDQQGQKVGVLFDATLVGWTRRELTAGTYHPLLVIANFVVEFLKIHPFLDGNGRLSRILTNLLMLRAGDGSTPFVSHERLVEANKTDYYIALRRAFGTTNETIEPWLTFSVSLCLTQAKEANDLVSAEAIEKLLSPAQLRVWDYLDDVGEAAPGAIAEATGVPRPSQARTTRPGRTSRATRYRKGLLAGVRRMHGTQGCAG
jgi:hypothetical protein